MGKKMLFVIAGPRLKGSTSFAAHAAADAAREAGNDVTIAELPTLQGHETGCIGCYGCQGIAEYRCVLDDEISVLAAAVAEYDTLVLASPVYFFSLTSQAKAFLDRLYCLMKYVDGKLVTPLTKIQLAVIATSGDDEAESGVRNVYKLIRDCAKYCGAPEPCFLHFGGCMDPKQFRADPANTAKAAAFGRGLTNCNVRTPESVSL